jgi:uncharacterized protein (TIGR03790 family)
MRILFLILAGSACASLAQSQSPADAPLNERVMVVYDDASEPSRGVAKYYMEKRHIPKGNLCKIDTTPSDSVLDAANFESEVKKPVRACLEKLGKKNILYIVLTYGTPFSVILPDGQYLAVDQMIADIWDEYTGANVPGRVVNNQPYFGNAQSQGNAYEPYISFAKYRDQPLSKTIYSVWRLDAATPQIAKSLVDKALYAESNGLTGKACFDIRGKIQDFQDNGYGAGEWDIYRASEFAKKGGFDTTLDDKPTEFGTAPSQLRCENAALYAGWYNLQHYNDAFSWAPGAIGFHLDSASATNPRRPDNWSGGALLKGITVTSGSMSEPFLEGLVHPDQIFLYLFQGAYVGDAVLRGTRWLKWMMLNFGDPLYRPFPQGAGPYGSTIYRENWLAIQPNTLIGGGNATGLLTLAESADKPMPVSFKTTNPELVTMPANSSIPPTGNGARFPIVAKAPKDPAIVTVSVTVGNNTLTNTLILYPLIMSFTLSQPSLKSDGTITGAVTLYAPAPVGVTVKLSSSLAEIKLPAEVKIPAGSARATFSIHAAPLRAEGSATITATIDNSSRAAQLKVIP